MEHIGHFALAVRAFLANDGGAHAGRGAAIGRNTEGGKRSVERSGQTQVERLRFIVVCALFSAAIETLERVHLGRSAVPILAQGVDVERKLAIGAAEREGATLNGPTEFDGGYTGFGEYGRESLVARIGHLHHHSGVFGEEGVREIAGG